MEDCFICRKECKWFKMMTSENVYTWRHGDKLRVCLDCELEWRQRNPTSCPRHTVHDEWATRKAVHFDAKRQNKGAGWAARSTNQATARVTEANSQAALASSQGHDQRNVAQRQLDELRELTDPEDPWIVITVKELRATMELQQRAHRGQAPEGQQEIQPEQ